MRLMVLNHRFARPLLVTLAAATTLAVFPAAAYADASQPAPVTGGLPLINAVEKIGPGINLKHVKALDQKGWYDGRFLTVDLSSRVDWSGSSNLAIGRMRAYTDESSLAPVMASKTIQIVPSKSDRS